MKKQVLGILFSLIMVIGLLPAAAFAATDDTISVTLPFTKIVKQGGKNAPKVQEFELEALSLGMPDTKEYPDVTITAKVQTSGAGTYESVLKIEGPESQVDTFLCESIIVREKNTGAENWTYDKTAYRIDCYKLDEGGWTFELYPIEEGSDRDSGNDEPITQATGDEPIAVDTMSFTNIYTDNSEPVVQPDDKDNKDSKTVTNVDKTPTSKASTETAPQTGDNDTTMIFLVALLIVSGIGIISVAIYSKKRKNIQ